MHVLAAPAPAPASQLWAPAAPAVSSAPPTNGFGAFPQNNSFVSEANFSNVFDNTDTAGELTLSTCVGDVVTLQPIL